MSFMYLLTTLTMPKDEIKKATPVSPRNIKGFVPKCVSRALPAINASIIGPAIQPETWVNISTPGFHQLFPLFKFCSFSFTKNKAKTALDYCNINKKLMQTRVFASIRAFCYSFLN